MNATPTIDMKRFAEVEARGLSRGAHEGLHDGMCAMEAVSYITDERWSDHPKCVSPVIAAFLRNWNDSLPDEDRTRLIAPLILKTVGTRGSERLEERRSLMAADWLVRVHTPAWLRLAGLSAHADALKSLPEITSMDQVPSVRGPIEAARKDAAAAGDAARAAWDAARDAARAAGAAARDAARAAGAAAWDAAWAAARVAAWDAARVAAWDALKTTVIELQASACSLIERMCALTDADICPPLASGQSARRMSSEGGWDEH